VAVTVVAPGYGFVVVHREERRACEPGSFCASPAVRRRMKGALWTATAVAVPLVTFPWWSRFVLG
jgi:mercuric ion transport protein